MGENRLEEPAFTRPILGIDRILTDVCRDNKQAIRAATAAFIACRHCLLGLEALALCS